MNKYKSSPICIKNWFPKLSSQLFCVHCTVYEKTLCLSFCDLKSNEKLYTKRPKMAECYNAPLRTLSTCTVIAKQFQL